MCGIFGYYADRPISLLPLMYEGLLSNQHRGQEGTGLMACEGKEVFHHRRLTTGHSSVDHFFRKVDLPDKLFSMAFGHNRYSTAGSIERIENLHPFIRDTRHGRIGIGHNGNIPGAALNRSELVGKGQSFEGDTDTEVILGYIALSRKEDLVSALIESLKKITGSYSLVVMNEHELIIARDPHGFRPLSIGTFDFGYLVSSETCAFETVHRQYGAKYWRDVEPGEIVVFDKNGVSSHKPFQEKAMRQCIFELIYFARPDSFLFGQRVHEFRMKLGERHAREYPLDVEFSVGVPDSANYFADGHSAALGIPHLRALVRSHYAGRVFISPNPKQRSSSVRRKLSFIRSMIKNRSFTLDDDSIVRGDTSKEIIGMGYEYGAKEITASISCPPIIGYCPFGIDMKTNAELIAYGRTNEEVRRHIGADNLYYLSLESLKEIAGEDFCYGCFTGEYPA